jgi:hypothetical protein
MTKGGCGHVFGVIEANASALMDIRALWPHQVNGPIGGPGNTQAFRASVQPNSSSFFNQHFATVVASLVVISRRRSMPLDSLRRGP